MRKEGRIRKLADLLTASYQEHERIIKRDARQQVSLAAVADILAVLRELVFAGFFGRKRLKSDSLEFYVGELLEEVSHSLQKQIDRALRHGSCRPAETFAADVPDEAERITYAFLERLPQVRALLATDVDAAFDGDPAAFDADEIILAYPGVYAIMVSRLAHELYLLKVPFIPRLMTEHAHSLTGIDIHPGASIGHHFFIDHGTGIVIGETTEIGDYVKIYQGVTLGALSTRGGQMLHGVKRHPIIENHVTIYSGASILGGATRIGEGVVIGSNAFITRSVPDKTRVSVKNPELQFMENKQAQPVEFPQESFWSYEI
jgi:serine O-acetyltransferase